MLLGKKNKVTAGTDGVPKAKKNPKIKKGLGIKWHIFGWLLLFTAIIISIIWITQGLFLDDIYKSIKIFEIKRSAGIIEEKLCEDDISEVAQTVAYRNDLCLILLDVQNNNQATEVCSVETLKNCVIHNIDRASKFIFYDRAKENGGVYLQRFRYDISHSVYIAIGSDIYDDLSADSESIVYTKICRPFDGHEYMIILNSTIAPVTATVKTLNLLLGAVSVLLVIIALAMAFIISKRISKPITKLCGGAKELARGNYNVNFCAKGFREIRELSDSLTYAESELQKVDSLRRELIANISHDLRTPLTMITGYAEAIRDLPGEDTVENMQIIIDEANRLTSLVNDVLDISKLESGVRRVNPESFNITETVREIAERYNKMKEKDGYSFEFESDREVTVYSDKTGVLQVAYNLVNNALTYTGSDKKIYIKQTVDEERGEVVISVRDTGEGIEPEKLPFIWDRYYKVDKVHRRASVGTGLGLSIVRNLMELLGGRYGVKSTVGEGSIFWFSIKAEL